jgi:ankyrin repeat protein
MDPDLDSAVAHGDVEAVLRRLDAGADVNARDRHGQTALMRAAHSGDGTMVEALLARGADPNVTAKYRLNAQMLAVIAGHGGIALRLADAGSDPAAQASGTPGFTGKTAAELALDRGMPELAAQLRR